MKNSTHLSSDQIEFATLQLTMDFLVLVERRLDQLGMTRKKFAEELGTSASFVTQIFRGNRTPSLELLARMGLALDLKFDISDQHGDFVDPFMEDTNKIISERENTTLSITQRFLAMNKQAMAHQFAAPAQMNDFYAKVS